MVVVEDRWEAAVTTSTSLLRPPGEKMPRSPPVPSSTTGEKPTRRAAWIRATRQTKCLTNSQRIPVARRRPRKPMPFDSTYGHYPTTARQAVIPYGTPGGWEAGRAGGREDRRVAGRAGGREAGRVLFESPLTEVSGVPPKCADSVPCPTMVFRPEALAGPYYPNPKREQGRARPCCLHLSSPPDCYSSRCDSHRSMASAPFLQSVPSMTS